MGRGLEHTKELYLMSDGLRDKGILQLWACMTPDWKTYGKVFVLSAALEGLYGHSGSYI